MYTYMCIPLLPQNKNGNTILFLKNKKSLRNLQCVLFFPTSSPRTDSIFKYENFHKYIFKLTYPLPKGGDYPVCASNSPGCFLS